MNRDSNKVNEKKVGEIINVENTRRNSMKFIAALNESLHSIPNAEIIENNIDNDNNKQIQILNLNVKTNVYSITLVTDGVEKNKFVCIPNQDRDNKNIFIYDYTAKESFV